MNINTLKVYNCIRSCVTVEQVFCCYPLVENWRRLNSVKIDDKTYLIFRRAIRLQIRKIQRKK